MSDDVVLAGVTKRFGPRAVVDDVSVTVRRGHLLALLGPSGSGKSTTLRLIAGLERVDAGTIHLGGELVSSPATSVPPERRRVGYVFQSFALFPHLSVEENVAFGARDRSRVVELLELVGLADRRRAAVDTLSGGEQQRVALVRALAMDPSVVLLDEPFANLDASLRRYIRDEVAAALRAREATAILVTHDASEAFALADHVAVVADGRVLQHGTPDEVYVRPASLEVAQRTGEVVMLAGRMSADGTVRTTLGAHATNDCAPGPELDVVAVARPEQLALDAAGAEVDVEQRVFEGASTSLRLRAGGERFVMRASGPVAVQPGERLRVIVRGAVRVFPRG